MNTISIPTTMSSTPTTAPAFKLLDSAFPRRPAVATWLPAPTVPPRELRRPAATRASWLMPPKRSPGERVMMGLLAAAALSGIGYGFVCLINLVQNWAVFQTGIANLVQ